MLARGKSAILLCGRIHNIVKHITDNIAFNTLVSYAGRVISSIFALVTVGLMTRALGQERFGEYTTITAYLSMFVILADLGLQVLMTREISRGKNDSSREVSGFFTLRLISSLAFLLIGLAALALFPYSSAIKIGMAIGASGFFFLSVNQLLLGVFQKHLAMHLTALAEVLGRGVQLLLVYLIYTLYIGQRTSYIQLFLFLGAMSAASLVIFVLQYYFTRKFIKIGWKVDIAHCKEILKTTWPIALSIVLTLIYFKIDTIFLSLMKPQADVGIYGVAYRVLESLIFFPAVFAGIMLPILSREAVSNLAQFRVVFNRAFRIITIFAVPMMVGGIVLAYSIANLIGGREFLAAGAPLQALFIATGLIFFGNLLGRAVIALDLQKKAALVYLFGVILNVALNFIFIPKYTYMGAAWTTVVTELMITVFLFWFVWKKARISLEISTIIKAVFAAAFMGLALLVFVPPITTPLSLLRLAVAMVLGGIVYFSTLYLFKGITKQEILAFFDKGK